ncbi:transposase [Rhodoferax sp.]|uniref:transposase n=1 Tax=Rhodoferax sp. TaxID=50421 RepID=UPI0026398F19|nr:transposase [Rhodoferax sp.]MDD2809726.1 transposase [Rhodoferax sp.]MDD4944482.1 transposase [Rhodoferax sp.]
MTRPRSSLVSLADTPWYHVVNRCVRRAFLCGQDSATGQNFDHRRGWIETRIRELASVFTIDVAAYAVMSNHYHVVLRVDADRAQALSDDAVLRRWTQLFSGPLLVQRYLSEARSQMGQAECDKVAEFAALYRSRLHDLSWFMRVLNESIARQANAEDDCTGRFWEGRFKSQALLDEQALLAAMAYVDLNPIRAGMAQSLPESLHTSIKARLDEIQGQAFEPVLAPVVTPIVTDAAPPAVTEAAKLAEPNDMHPASVLPSLLAEAELATLPEAPLMPFDVTSRFEQAIPFGLQEYIDLVDTMGHAVHPTKRGAMPAATPPILTRLGMDAEAFINAADHFFKDFASAVGTPAKLIEIAAQRQQRALRGLAAAKRMFERKAA